MSVYRTIGPLVIFGFLTHRRENKLCDFVLQRISSDDESAQENKKVVKVSNQFLFLTTKEPKIQWCICKDFASYFCDGCFDKASWMLML